MSHTLTVEEAAAQLAKLISDLKPGDEITLTTNNQPIAKIVPQNLPVRRHAGACKGMLSIVREDDEHLADFKDYM